MTFSPEVLTRIICHHRPNLACAPSITPITTGKFNASYWVEADGEQLVLRIAPPRDAVYVFYEKEMMRQEPAIHELLLAQTGIPVARILAFDDSLTLLARDYMLMERLPGHPLTEMGHVDFNHVLYQVGVYLAEAHRLSADAYTHPGKSPSRRSGATTSSKAKMGAHEQSERDFPGELFGYLGKHTPMRPQQSWVDAFVIMWHKMIDDIVAVGYYDEAESTAMRHLLDRSLALFDRPVSASLLHMDIWHQNILVDDTGTVTGLVDWDRALWGDPEIEFAVLDYCSISESAFWEGYGQVRDWSSEARVRQLFYLLYELQKYIVIYHGRNGDPGGAMQKKQQVMKIVRDNPEL